MATKFPKFSQALAQDPATRRIWYGIATAHDLESHDGMTEESLYQKIFASHFGHLAIIFLWTSGNLFHVAWQGNFQQWVLNPLKVKPIAHAIWDPHFGQSAIKAFTRGGVSYPVNIATSGVYHWWYTIGMRTNTDLYFGALGLLVLATTLLFAGWLHLQPKFRPGLAWFKNNESRLNHHLSGLFGFSSLAWSGHLIHVAIPESRGQHIRWDNFTSTLPMLLPGVETVDFKYFIDVGNVWGVDYSNDIDESNKIRSATGVGVEWFTPIGPMTFSLAQHLSKASTDKTESFQFNLGTTF